MDKLDIMIWVMGAGFTLMFGLLLIVWTTLWSAIKDLSQRIDKLDEKVTDIDRRLCRLEGAFSAKDFCMLKNDSHFKHTENG